MIYTRKKNLKFLIFFVEKSEILGGFYLQKKTFFCIKKNVLPKIVKKREKISGDPQIFFGDELDIKGL